MNFTKDNYWNTCPAVMNYCQFTDYRTPSAREEYIKSINNISCRSDNAYRYFLQNNTNKIIKIESELLNNTFNCRVNECIHYSPLRQPEGDQYVELKRYNDTRAGYVSGKVDPATVKCPVYL